MFSEFQEIFLETNHHVRFVTNEFETARMDEINSILCVQAWNDFWLLYFLSITELFMKPKEKPGHELFDSCSK